MRHCRPLVNRIGVIKKREHNGSEAKSIHKVLVKAWHRVTIDVQRVEHKYECEARFN